MLKVFNNNDINGTKLYAAVYYIIVQIDNLSS